MKEHTHNPQYPENLVNRHAGVYSTNADVFGCWLWLPGEDAPRAAMPGNDSGGHMAGGTYSPIVVITPVNPVPTYGRTLARRDRKAKPGRAIRHIRVDED